jgi:serine/threonine protein kinase
MGIVYLGEREDLHRKAAIKILHPWLAERPEAVQRFFSEARAANLARHPNIVDIYDYGKSDKAGAFLVMELLEGQTLSQYLRKKRKPSIEFVSRLVERVASALSAAHAQKVIHRDLKPDNIFLVPDPNHPDEELVKILDFGLAKLKEPEESQVGRTRTGQLFGTPTYMSPEQCSGAKLVDHRTDIYSLGVIAYELLCSRPPFVAEGAGELIALHLDGRPPPLRTLNPELPLELEQAVLRALEKRPGRRFATAKDFASAMSVAFREIIVGDRSPSGLPARQWPADESSPTIAREVPREKVRKSGARRISQRLSESSKRAFVGREQELETISGAFGAPELPFVVAYIHGPGGIGKSFLLRSLSERDATNSQVIFLDCRDMEPTAAGFLQKLGTVLGLGEGGLTLDEVSWHLSERGARTLLCLDQYENFTLMDTWLRQDFLPALPDTVLTVIASRQAPKSAWLTTPGWQGLFHEIKLSELSEEESHQMLETRHLEPDQIQQVKQFAHGHPLALELGAAALRSQPGLEVNAGPPAKMVSQLTRALLSGLSRDVTEAVEAISTIRWTTEPVLRSLLGVAEVRNLFDELGELPFVYSTPEGLVLHDVVHEAVAKDLSHRDPERYRLYRSRAWRIFSAASRGASEHHLWHLTADMLYLIENPVVREAFFPAGSTEYVVQPAAAEDSADILQIARSEETGEAARQIERWLDRHADSFSVAKGNDGKVAGFYFSFEPDKVDSELLSTDPLTVAWSKHLEENPVMEREQVLFLRRWLAKGTGDDFSAVQGACWLDIKRLYMEMRPHLRRLYTTVNDLAVYAPVVIPLGFAPIDDAHVELGGRMYHSALLDFGEDSVDGWLKGLVKAELGVESDASGPES